MEITNVPEREDLSGKAQDFMKMCPLRDIFSAGDSSRGRGLLKPEDRTKSWPVIQACYAALLTEKAMQWLFGTA